MSKIKRYYPDTINDGAGNIQGCMSEDNEDGEYLNIEELIGNEHCDKGDTYCPFYSEYNGTNLHKCGVNGEWENQYTKLSCPFRKKGEDNV